MVKRTLYEYLERVLVVSPFEEWGNWCAHQCIMDDNQCSQGDVYVNCLLQSCSMMSNAFFFLLKLYN